MARAQRLVPAVLRALICAAAVTGVAIECAYGSLPVG